MRRALGWLVVKIGAIALVVVLALTYAYGLAVVRGEDMSPAAKDGDLILFDRLDKHYVVGDLLVLRYDGATQVQRVVATAGDTVDITSEGLVLNGNSVYEPEIHEKTSRYDSGVTFPLTVGRGQVFVLGDARQRAVDSRVYGAVKARDTLGTVMALVRRRGL